MRALKVAAAVGAADRMATSWLRRPRGRFVWRTAAADVLACVNGHVCPICSLAVEAHGMVFVRGTATWWRYLRMVVWGCMWDVAATHTVVLAPCPYAVVLYLVCDA